MNPPDWQGAQTQRWVHNLRQRTQQLAHTEKPAAQGRLTRLIGLTLEAVGCDAPVGDWVEVIDDNGACITAEVVGFNGERLLLMPSGSVQGVRPRARVRRQTTRQALIVGDCLLGRVLDGNGQLLDGGPPLQNGRRIRWQSTPINPLARPPIRQPLDVGVRAINGLLTVGQGQRIGLFAGSGVGKSMLLGMMTRFTRADVVVVGLIGERGREVQEFIEDILGEDGRARSVVVAAPADAPPLLRLRGADLATRIAESFRDAGHQVLLLMDSLTRYAQAQREIALAIGEPPATKGYPPSAFALLPRLVERAGTYHNGGAITAFYTVLAEGDDQQDPIVDAARAILDGHIVLSRQLADQGQYPAIDIEASISRVMPRVTDEAQQQQARRFKQVYATYQRYSDLIRVGAYQRGSDVQVDQALAVYPQLQSFLAQGVNQAVDLPTSRQLLSQLMGQLGGF